MLSHFFFEAIPVSKFGPWQKLEFFHLKRQVRPCMKSYLKGFISRKVVFRIYATVNFLIDKFYKTRIKTHLPKSAYTFIGPSTSWIICFTSVFY